MKIILSNLRGVKYESPTKKRHFVKAGSRWPMTIGYTESVDYYPYPFFLAYSTALLKKEIPGSEVKGIDGVSNDYTNDMLYQAVSVNAPDIFIAEVTFIDLDNDLAFLKKIKENFSSIIIVTGVYASSFQERVLIDNPFVDFAIYGEYEISLKHLISCLVKKDIENLKNIAGLIYKDDKKILKHTASASISNLDELPFPDRTDFNPAMYSDFSFYSPCISLMATRGCPGGCSYCVERHVIYNSPKYRMRNYKFVVDEMEECIKLYGAKQFYFDDQSLVVNRAFVENLCNEILKRKLNIPWTCMGDAMFVDFDILKLMARAGCIGMKFGIESANKTILKNIGKPLDLNKAIEVSKWCKKFGIMTHATFCIGLMGETEDTVRETLSFMNKLHVDSSQVSKAVPYPGTPMYKWAKENGYLTTDNLELYDGSRESVISYPSLSASRIDYWYNKISRITARKKFLNYVKHPKNSLDIIQQLYRQKGLAKTLQSLFTFIGRAF